MWRVRLACLDSGASGREVKSALLSDADLTLPRRATDFEYMQPKPHLRLRLVLG